MVMLAAAAVLSLLSVVVFIGGPAASKINQIAIVANDTRTSTTCAVSQLEPPINTTTETNDSTAAAVSVTIATAHTQSVSNSCSPTAEINHTAITTTR